MSETELAIALLPQKPVSPKQANSTSVFLGRGRENCLSCEQVIGKATHEIDVFGNIHNVRPISFMIFDPSSEDFMNHLGSLGN